MSLRTSLLCHWEHGFSNKNIFRLSSAGNKGDPVFVDTWRESILDRGKDKGKDPEVGACSSCMRNSKTSGIMDAQSRREW